jgi:DNA-binding phage protein
MTKRNLFSELKDGMDALAAMRDGRVTPFDASKYLDNEETVAAYLREAFSSGDERLIEASLSDVEKAAPSGPIKSKADYDRAVMVVNALLDAGGGDEKHRLATLVNRLGEFISDYESAHGR